MRDNVEINATGNDVARRAVYSEVLAHSLRIAKTTSMVLEEFEKGDDVSRTAKAVMPKIEEIEQTVAKLKHYCDFVASSLADKSKKQI